MMSGNSFVPINDLQSDNRRLFISGLPRKVQKFDVQIELKLNGVRNVAEIILYESTARGEENRGFVFVEFDSHQNAAKTRAAFKNKLVLFGNKVTLDWSYPLPVVLPEVMAQVKRLFMRNLPKNLTKHVLIQLLKTIVPDTHIEKVFKEHYYCFIHFSTRLSAEVALMKLKEIFHGSNVEITWSKPTATSGPLRHKFFKKCRHNHPTWFKVDNYNCGIDSQRTPSTTQELNLNLPRCNKFSQTWPKRALDFRYTSEADNKFTTYHGDYDLPSSNFRERTKWWDESSSQNNDRLDTFARLNDFPKYDSIWSAPISESSSYGLGRNELSSYNVLASEEAPNCANACSDLDLNFEKLWNSNGPGPLEGSYQLGSDPSLKFKMQDTQKVHENCPCATGLNKVKKQLDTLWNYEVKDELNNSEINYNELASMFNRMRLNKQQDELKGYSWNYE